MFACVGQKAKPPEWARVGLLRNGGNNLTVNHPGKNSIPDGLGNKNKGQPHFSFWAQWIFGDLSLD